MKYTPGLLEKNSNVSHEHPLREFFVLVIGATAIFLAVALLLGLFVDYAVRYIDPELESVLFSGFATEDESAPTEQEQKLQALLDRLSKCVDVGYPVVVSVTESDQMNAFAMPGGKVVVLSAMLDKVETENGLAFVLAHELAHFKNRDHLRGMGRSIVLLAISVLITGANSDISALLTPVYSADAAQYSQDRESDADAIALGTLNCHYGHVGGASEFFELIAAPDDELDLSLTHYFSSHPEAQNRIDDLNALAERRGYATK
jgi:Zn-dependent protease with chaperone function